MPGRKRRDHRGRRREERAGPACEVHQDIPVEGKRKPGQESGDRKKEEYHRDVEDAFRGSVVEQHPVLVGVMADAGRGGDGRNEECRGQGYTDNPLSEPPQAGMILQN